MVDENGERLFLMRSGARRLPAEVDGITFAAYPDVLLVLPGLTAGAVLVDSYSGGAHCCSSIQLIDLDPGKPSVRWWKELGNDGALVIDADGDGVPEILTGDDGFAYWERYSYAESPRTAVILRWNGSTFVPDTGRLLPADAQMISSTMAKRGRETPERALAAWLFALRTKGALGQEFIPPAVVTQLLLDLIYRGRGDLAHAWLLAHWPNSLDRWEFIRHFSAQLENCRFFPATDALTPLEHRWPR